MPSPFDQISAVLKELNDSGRVKASIVATDEGFVIASAVRHGVDEKVAAAMGSFVHNAAERARKELELGSIRDIAIRCEDGIIVCKASEMEDGRPIILAALVPRKTRFYIRFINRAHRKIRSALGQLVI
jgi:predicted regulator of Ras-like GTPase activity (Roadblock/LC7/MglB family)